jgi:hypothetical protein
MSLALVPNDSLRPDSLPPPDASWPMIAKFALTFDGYAVHGSFEACGAIANERRHDSLSDLRTCLFFEQRRSRHQGDDYPDAEMLRYVQSLVERIREIVSAAPSSASANAPVDGPARLVLTRVDYASLNARQKENFNFLKLSAILADYGYMTMRLSDDWQGADFIAQHVDGGTFLKVQLKARLAFGKKYMGKDLYVAFPAEGEWYLYPHDELLERVLATTRVGGTASWSANGGYTFPTLSQQMRELLAPYRIARNMMEPS